MTVEFMKQNPTQQGGGSSNAKQQQQTYVTNPNISNVNFGRIADYANQTSDPEMAKYFAAVDLARQKFSGKEEANEKLFRKTIDDIYTNELGGTLNPDTEIRGNNFMTQAVRGMNEGYDDFLTLAGAAIDRPWDAVAGGIADMTGQHEAADKLRNLMDDRAAGTAVDIGIDLGMSVLPFGIPAVMAKNMIQQSDNIDEAIKGYDNVTLEKLTNAQRAARGGEAALTTALAAIPGVGRANKLIKASKQDAADAMLKEAENTFKKVSSVPKKANEDLKTAQSVVDDINSSQEKLDLALEQRKKLRQAYDEFNQIAANQNGSRAARRSLQNAKNNLDSIKSNIGKDHNATVDNLDDMEDIVNKASESRNAAGKLRVSERELENAKAAKQEADDIVEGARKNVESAENFSNKNFLQRAIQNEMAGGRNAVASIRGIPEDYRRGKEIVDQMTEGLKLEGIEKLPRTNRGILKLIKEHPEYFDIEVPEKIGSRAVKIPENMTPEEWLVENLDKVVKPGRQQQMAAMYGNQIRQNIGRTNLTGSIGRALRNIGEATKPENFSPKLWDETQKEMLEKLRLNQKVKGTSKEKLANYKSALASSLAGVGTLGLQGGLAGMATGDYDNLQQGVMATFRDIERHPWKFIPGLFPVGAKRASMKMNPGIRGELGSSVPFNAARGAGLGNYITSQTEPDTSEATNEEEIIRRLAALKAGE